MMYRRLVLVLSAAALLLVASDSQAQTRRGGGREGRQEGSETRSESPSEAKADRPAPEEKHTETRHRITIGGQAIDYTATAGTLLLKEEDGTAKASIFYIAYTRDGVTDPRRRPLIFSFNGGPGSSSVWLHLGLLGPRRVLMSEEGWALPPPYRLVDIFRFTKELLRADGRTVGRLDSRFEGIDRDAAGETFDYDPSMAAIQGPYTAMLNDYVRRDLGFESDLPYEILTGRVQPWNYGSSRNRYLNVAETLREAMTRNPSLRVFVANGYYDLATPYYATDYTFRHLGLDPSLRDHVAMGYYEAGHMMYIHQPSLVALKRDLASFIDAAVPAGD